MKKDIIINGDNRNVIIGDNRNVVINGKVNSIIINGNTFEKYTDYETIHFKNKEFRIYKWEDKQVSDLINKDFTCKFWGRLAEFQELQELIENDKIELGFHKYYITKHFNRKQWSKELCLLRSFLSSGSDLYSFSSSLLNSYDNGRVVVVK